MGASFRKLRSGAIEGDCDDAICRFLGVPYAAPPVGNRRFEPPQAVEPWDGTRNARKPGPCAPQRIRPFPVIDITPLVGTGGPHGDDYLTCNVWTPARAKDAPVMVFVHGGAFVLGSKDAAVHDGSAFARSGIVCVSINYRLGIEGFVPLDDGPTNLGLRDILFALQWVKDNVEAFGGDPNNVTIFGESAGAMLISDLVASPLSKGLFRRAIVQSGHGSMVRKLPVARRVAKRLAKILRIPATKTGFASVDFDSSWKALEKISRPIGGLDVRDEDGFDPVFGLSRIVPVVGDDVIPEPPLDALRKGAGKDVELLIGTNTEEMNLYLVPTKVKTKIPGLLARWMLGKSHRSPRELLRAYGMGTGRRAGHVLTDAMSDLVFRAPARAFAEAHQGKTHVYEFDWRSNACDGELGASHGVELPFVFKTLETTGGEGGLTGSNPPAELADRLHKIWVRFATDGSLPWPQFDAEDRKVHLLAANETVSEPVMPASAFLPN